MRNSSGQQRKTTRVKNERQWKKSQQQHKQQNLWWTHKTYFFHNMCNYKVLRCGRGKQRQINVQKKCAARAKFFLLLFGLLTFLQLSLPSPFNIARVTHKNTNESFAFIPG